MKNKAQAFEHHFLSQFSLCFVSVLFFKVTECSFMPPAKRVINKFKLVSWVTARKHHNTLFTDSCTDKHHFTQGSRCVTEHLKSQVIGNLLSPASCCIYSNNRKTSLGLAHVGLAQILYFITILCAPDNE